MSAVWVERRLRDLTDDEQTLIASALGAIPHDHGCSSLAELWERFGREDVGLFTLQNEAGEVEAATFYQIERLPDGSLHFESLATVALRNIGRDLAAHDFPVMEACAASLNCVSIGMQTIRPALVRELVDNQGWFIAGVILKKRLHHG
jgi:hypothetical protein